MRGADLRNLKEDKDDEREENGNVALVAVERKRVVDEAEEAATLPRAVAAMNFVEIVLFGAATGNERDGRSVSRSNKCLAVWGFRYMRSLSFCFGSTWPTKQPCLATRFCNSTSGLDCNPIFDLDLNIMQK